MIQLKISLSRMDFVKKSFDANRRLGKIRKNYFCEA